MRLNQIKLSGFKSFAEPTTFQLPGQRVGVVGPNGCGKSNIMDAVRWVLGESKASELRGESMQDVIFNGSGNRKPASRASVELVFNNESGRAGGVWNQYAEIAVKRVLTRDGNSSYFINNQAVRRRDVQDVFLGTGLGPRAYAIIGQGTISRIIESRPEELRLFLEEAAGVSKYKERRRETENRLKDTRENLTRVEDILRELNANLDKLEHQAEVATRYRGLQEQGTLKLHQLWFLKHRDAATEEERVKLAMLEATNALESRMAELRHVEAQLETIRQAHYEASDALHTRQGDLAQASLEVSRLEERIRYVVEGRQRAQARLGELQAQNEQWQQRREEALIEQETIAEQIAAAEEQAEILAAQAEEEAGSSPQHEEAVRAAQARANEQRTVVAQVQQQIQVLAAESRNIDEQSRGLRARRERLASERQGLAAPDADKLQSLREELSIAEEAAAEAEARLHELSEQLPALDEQRRSQQTLVNREGARQADLTARLEALRALQEKVQTEGKLKPWLAKHGLDGLQGLWTKVHIEPGWEVALEAALDPPADLPPGELQKLVAETRSRIAEANREQEKKISALVQAAQKEGIPKFQTFAKCADCHFKQFDFWRNTPHARAYEVLVKAGQHQNLECLSCHSVGLNDPEGYSRLHQLVEWSPADPEDGKKKAAPPVLESWISELRGARPTAARELLRQASRVHATVQCENCHSAGRDHPFGLETRPKVVASESCLQCHTAERAPGWYLTVDGRPKLDDSKVSANLKKMACPAGDED